MSIRVIKRSEQVVDDDGNVIAEVHGLSLNDIYSLYDIHSELLAALYKRFAGKDVMSITEDEAIGIATDAINLAPALIAQVIALGADANDEIKAIIDMPVGLQLACIEKIWKLTFTAGFGPKKVVALIGEAIKTNQGG